MYASGALMGLSLFVPFVFLIRYAEEQGIAPGTAATLVSVLGVGSMGGRLVHQHQVAVVQIAHGRHEGDTTQRGTRRAHRIDGFVDLHDGTHS